MFLSRASILQYVQLSNVVNKSAREWATWIITVGGSNQKIHLLLLVPFLFHWVKTVPI